MNVVILQPSYIPWRGYFDQIRRADLFIFYDDVQYDKHGWRNRNQIKTAQGKQWITIPVHSKGVTEGIPIKDVRIDWSKSWPKKHLNALTFAYAKAPFFASYQPWLESVYNRTEEFLADFTIDITVELAGMLGITSTKFMRSSEIPGIDGQKTDRLIQILQHVGARHYLSGPSARDYVEQDKFDEAGITLEFIQYDYPEYPQLHPPYDPFVTVLDLIFMVGEDALSYIVSQEETIE
ncbi:MAG: WbqC family protein [Anaerolineales bacterium]|nr:WbqC family protein [Anaerolineales bacterium]